MDHPTQEPDASSVDADASEAPISSEAFTVPQRRLWPWLLGLLVVLGVGGFFVWRSVTAPLPLRVLVAIDVDGTWWEGSRAGAEVADRLGALLDELGFQPVKAGDPEVEAVLVDTDDPMAAARDLKAAFVIVGRLEPEKIEYPVPGGQTELRVDGTLEVRNLADDGPAGTVSIQTFASAKTPERAQELLARSIAKLVAHEALPVMVKHDTVQAILQGSDPKLVDEVAPGKNYVHMRALKLDEVAQAYANLEERMGKEPAVTFHSPPQAADQLIAVTEGGVLVNSAAARPIYSPSSHELGWSSDLERLGVRAPDGTLSSRWKGPSSVTYPSASAHGFPAAIVEYLYGGRALTLVRDDGTVDRLVVSGERRLSEPRINPGGNRIAYVNTPCKGCRRELAVRTVGDDAITWQLTGDQYLKMGTFRWLDDDHLLLFARLLGEDEVYSLWSVDVTKGTRKGLIEITGAQRVADPAVHPKGTHVAVAHQNEGAVVVYERASGETTAYPVGGRARALTYHPDGRRIAFELDAGGRTEIALLDVSSKKVTELTHNQREDRFPHFSPDGTRLYFEARAPDPALPRREVMRVASVAVP